MCGRFAQFSSLDVLGDIFHFDTVACEVQPNYNVAPTQKVLAIIQRETRQLVKLYWGLVPFWAKDTTIGSRMINARSETVAEKPSFRTDFRKRRCLIFADGFYEWKGANGQKQPFFIGLPSKEPFAFAGIWERWKAEGGSEYLSCSIITTEANESLKHIHQRMPVVLLPETHDLWLDPRFHDAGKLTDLLEHSHVENFKAYPVSRLVNSVTNNGPECVEPILDG